MKISSNPVYTKENLINKYSSRTNLIYITVVLALLIFLFSLPYVKIDVTTQSRAIVRSEFDDVPIYSVIGGRIDEINISYNQEVKEGDTLVVINRNTLNSQQKFKRQLIKNDSLLLNDLIFALKKKYDSLVTPTLKEAYERYDSQLKELVTKRTQARITYQRNKTLYDKGVIARAEFDKHDFNYKQATQAVRSYMQQQISDWESQKRNLQNKIQDDIGIVERLETEEENYYITAPRDGIIRDFIGLQNQSFIQPQQPIAYISPIQNLIVESMVSPKDIGLIKVGQEVKYQIDAFNYNQWGFVYGKVIEIDNNLSIDNQNAFFKVRSSIDDLELKLDNGYKTQVKKGMTLTSRFLVTERSLYDLLFDKIDDWLNPKTYN
ncbi:MAG: HlyD family efflux transporter periplasmic adaptor subunit [Bacteroidetes bacterium]|jgi:HlyD family secretion protein|nr:HlyD family efflux transporter periplasmic adaptor subunit [Bacteroidota bacterium]